MRKICTGLLFVFATVALADSASCPPNYGYSGFTPPSQWQFIAEDCGTGQFQSPIDISSPSDTRQNEPITVNYQTMTLTVKNSGHDFRVIPTLTNTISVGDIESATLDNFHFHSPAEHTLDGKKALDGEIHFVHTYTNADNETAIVVIAVPLKKMGNDSNALQPIIAQLPINVCATKTTSVAFQPLLSTPITTYYRYVGSLTTPKCSPNVTFLVVPTTIPISEHQLSTLRTFGDNARPLQPRNGRSITQVTP